MQPFFIARRSDFNHPSSAMTHCCAPVQYHVHPHDLHAHLYHVSLTIAQPHAKQMVSLPVWIPGSYLVREFAKNLQRLHAQQERFTPSIEQISKNEWCITCDPTQALTLTYDVSAYDSSVRTAWLDLRRGFFNGTSLLLRAHGWEKQGHNLTIHSNPQVPDWEVATALTPISINPNGFGTYSAPNYDELIDAPVELGTFWSGSFMACGIPHRFVIAGAAATLDSERLLRDTQKICETAIQFWGTAAHQHYVFMLNVTHDGYGGLEHKNSTALICSRNDLPRLGDVPQSEGYTQLLGLISHEYFHTWNVKRLRPTEFISFDYNRENYTPLLWFFEGFTSYYDDLLLRRAQLIDNVAYLKLINKTLQNVLQTPGRLVQSLAQASFDAWVKYYRQDENTNNITVSYYTKGALTALCLDLKLRQEGQTTLDAVMRGIWQRCKGAAMTEADVLDVLQTLTGRSWHAEIEEWIHSTHELPWQSLLEAHGVRIQTESASIAQQLGIRVQEAHSIIIKQVLRSSLAEQAGFMAGDEWYGVALPESAQQGWRLSTLEDLQLYVPAQTPYITALVARDKQLLQLSLNMPSTHNAVQKIQLKIADEAAVSRWLAQ